MSKIDLVESSDTSESGYLKGVNGQALMNPRDADGNDGTKIITGKPLEGLFYRCATQVVGTAKQITFSASLEIKRLNILVVPYAATAPADIHGLVLVNATSSVDVAQNFNGGVPEEKLTGAGGLRVMPIPLNTFIEDFVISDVDITTVDVISAKGASAAVAVNFYIWGQP